VLGRSPLMPGVMLFLYSTTSCFITAMFLRFVITQIDEDSHKPQGLFQAAYDLLESGDLSVDERGQLREVLIWFNKHLPSPRRMVASRAIFWFKSSADECINRVWELAHLLRYHGYLVDVQKCRELGNIIYEDSFQVAAYPSKRDRK
jgi:hypothetical protein